MSEFKVNIALVLYLILCWFFYFHLHRISFILLLYMLDEEKRTKFFKLYTYMFVYTQRSDAL